MSATTESISSVLNGLIETCRDGQTGFHIASNDVHNLALKALFFARSNERAHYAAQLEDFIREIGEEIGSTGSVTGALHRAWINIKSAFSDGAEASLLSECIRGEESAIAAYDEALQHVELRPGMRDVLAQQASIIRESLVRLLELEATYQPV